MIDPVLERVDRYIQLLDELDLKLVKVVDTHVHADHITGMGELRNRTKCITVMGENSPVDVVSMRVKEGETIDIEGKPAGYSDHAGLLAEVSLDTTRPVRLPPSAEAVAQAASFLREGRGNAERRRHDQRGLAAGGGVVALAAVGSASMAPISRRGLLRAAAIGLPAIALASTAGVGWLADRVVADELAGYDKVERLLERIGRAANIDDIREGGSGQASAAPQSDPRGGEA